MAIDSSIYQTMQAPDILGGIQQGLKLSDMAQDRKIKQNQIAQDAAMKDAYSKNSTMGADGKMTFNRQGAMSQLTQGGYGKQAYDMQVQGAKDDRDAQSANMAMQDQKLQHVSSLLNGVKDPQSYQFAVDQGIKHGYIQPGEAPAQYDPQWVDQHKAMAQSAQDYLAQQNKEKELGFKERDTRVGEQKVGIENKSANAKIDENQIKREELQTHRDDDYMKHVEDRAEGYRSDPAAMMASTKLGAVASAKALLDQYKGRYDEMPLDAVRSLVTDKERAFSGGVPTEGAVDSMMPHGPAQMWAGLMGKFRNGPQPANAGKYIENLESQFRDLESGGQSLLKARQDGIAASPRLTPAQADRIRSIGVPPRLFNDEAKTSSAAASQPHPQDSAAVQWASQNPTDPRASYILKLNGQSVGKR